MTKPTLTLRVDQVRDEAAGIRSFVLVDPKGGSLPPFTVGGHIDLHLPNGMMRSYSLFNDQDEHSRYEIAVARDANSRGGSILLHDTVEVGQLIEVGLPRNHFPLSEGPHPSVLIAGGIGITPILAMARRLLAQKRDFALHYAARSRLTAAFVETLAEFGDRVRMHFDDERGTVLDVAEIAAQAASDAHLYCCGPKPMLDAFQMACAAREPETIHIEQFTADVAAKSPGDTFTVHLMKSKQSFEVLAGETILDVLLRNGIDVPYSCMEGTCGECQVKVSGGLPDHRDVVLTKKKRAENSVMMICCSRSFSPALTLEI